MRIKVQLPKVDPTNCKEPEECPYEDCKGRYFKPHGQKGEVKAIRDLYHQEVKSYRWKCMKCGRTFRMYPQGVSKAQQSAQLKAMSVLLYVLGLSYGAVSDFLAAMGVSIGKTTVYENVQEAGERSRVRQAREIEEGGKRAAMGADGTYVKVRGEKVGLEVLVDDESGDLLGLEIIVSESAEELLEIVREVAEKIEADVLISDDLDAYKSVADELGLEHQTCRSHINRNVEDGIESMRQQARKEEKVPEGVDSSLERLEADLTQIEQIVYQRPDDGAEQLEALYHRYKAGIVSKKQGEKLNSSSVEDKSALGDERSERGQLILRRNTVVDVSVETHTELLRGFGEGSEGIPGAHAIRDARTQTDIALAHALPRTQFSGIVVKWDFRMYEDLQERDLFGACLGNAVVKCSVAGDGAE